jgi:hypothetical protein
MTDTPTFRRSYETQALVERLSRLEQGQSLAYADLAAAAGCPVTGATPALASARRIVETETGAVFAVDRGLCVRRLTDAEIVEATPGARTRIARAAKNAARRLAGVQDYAGLTDAQKRAHQAHAAIYAIIADAASRPSVKRLETTARPDGAALLAAMRRQS